MVIFHLPIAFSIFYKGSKDYPMDAKNSVSNVTFETEFSYFLTIENIIFYCISLVSQSLAKR